MRTIITALGVMPLFVASVSMGAAVNVDERYPFRLPDWLWDTAATAHLLSADDVLTLRGDIAKLAQLDKASNSVAYDALESTVATQLSSKFTVRDVVADAFVASNPQTGMALAVHIDPSFDELAKATIQTAVSQFVKVALDPEVMKEAVERSTLTPSPMPPMYELEKENEKAKEKPKIDAVGRPVFTSDYRVYLRLRVRPKDAAVFSRELHQVFVQTSGEPTVLLISRYAGNIWWGGSHNNYYSNPMQQLARESPPRGYFYIRLNSDKFKETEVGWNDPKFWASKIAHELLHNLGYWHPVYKTVQERDENNTGNSWSFLVSYEDAILRRLQHAQ